MMEMKIYREEMVPCSLRPPSASASFTISTSITLLLNNFVIHHVFFSQQSQGRRREGFG